MGTHQKRNRSILRKHRTLSSLTVHPTPIPGLLIIDLPVHSDRRGWFKENWQREKMVAAGVPDFRPVQNNISFNSAAGTTRGFHAEPWDKAVSVATGRAFGAWVDLREGATFGTTYTAALDPSRAVFVPRGVANAFQTLTAGTAYTYLVNAHWYPEAQYTYVNLADPSLGIEWPVQLSDAEMSDQDRNHPPLAEVRPILRRKILVLGAEGQVGLALRQQFGESEHVEYAARADLDITHLARRIPPESWERWSNYDTIINAAAYTAVDEAETFPGRTEAWRTNASAVAALSRLAAHAGSTLVHLSSDYVFDGKSTQPYREDDEFNPLSVYGQTKAAGDLSVSTAPNHYIIRTAGVVGDGNNFVRTMRNFAARAPNQQGAHPQVVADQYGRPTFANELAAGINHLLYSGAPFGTYNLTNSGATLSWAELAKEVFRLCDSDPDRVQEVTTAEYLATAGRQIAPRPLNSTLDLSKINDSGFAPSPALIALEHFLSNPRLGE